MEESRWKGHVAAHTTVDGARVLTADGQVSCSSIGLPNWPGSFTAVAGSARAGAHVMRIKNNKTPGWEMDVKTLGVAAGVESGSTGAKATAGAHLLDADVGVFRARLGVGVDTGAMIKDDTVEAKALGNGFKVGRHVGLSVLNNEFSVDVVKVAEGFGRWFR